MKINKDMCWYGEPCSRCEGQNEPYMLNSKLWSEIVKKSERNKCICLTCVRAQLNRNLVLADFNDAPINHGIFGFSKADYIKLQDIWDPFYEYMRYMEMIHN